MIFPMFGDFFNADILQAFVMGSVDLCVWPSPATACEVASELFQEPHVSLIFNKLLGLPDSGDVSDSVTCHLPEHQGATKIRIHTSALKKSYFSFADA